MRTNYTLTEPDGTTTKLNEPGASLDDGDPDAPSPTRCTSTPPVRAGSCCRARCRRARRSTGTPTLVAALRDTGARIAVDTSEAPLLALLAAGPASAPDLLKPNTEELAQLTGVAEEDLLGDRDATLAAVRDAARPRAWPRSCSPSAATARCCPPPTAACGRRCRPAITVRSTVGAGDCSLAGYLLADLAGAPPAERLRTAVAYGSAAASLPGSAVPTPAQVDGSAVRVTSGAPSDARTAPTATPPRPPAGVVR